MPLNVGRCLSNQSTGLRLRHPIVVASRDRLDTKIQSGPHYKDRTVSRPSYIYSGDPYIWIDRLYIETGPWTHQDLDPSQNLIKSIIWLYQYQYDDTNFIQHIVIYYIKKHPKLFTPGHRWFVIGYPNVNFQSTSCTNNDFYNDLTQSHGGQGHQKVITIFGFWVYLSHH